LGFRDLKYWVPALGWMGLIFSGSTGLLADSRTSRFIEPVLRWLWPGLADERVWQWVYVIRKAAHVTEYAVLAVLLVAALNRTFRLCPPAWSWRRAGLALVVCGVYAVSDEWHQSFEPTRYASWRDVGFDLAGATLGLGVLWALGRWRQRR
jgi:VanZ family protein